jgi:hypothetical protein
MSNVSLILGPFSFDRIVRAVEKVQERLVRACRALDAANIQYAVCGGNAVAFWVSQFDASAVRNTRDVDILIRRGDFAGLQHSLESAGFVYRRSPISELFLDGSQGKVRDAIRILFANEKVRADEQALFPDVIDAVRVEGMWVLSLDPLVRMSLTRDTREDRMLLRDMIDVGAVNSTWIPRLSVGLATRLQSLLDDPNG